MTHGLRGEGVNNFVTTELRPLITRVRWGSGGRRGGPKLSKIAWRPLLNSLWMLRSSFYFLELLRFFYLANKNARDEQDPWRSKHLKNEWDLHYHKGLYSGQLYNWVYQRLWPFYLFVFFGSSQILLMTQPKNVACFISGKKSSRNDTKNIRAI